MCSSYLPEGRWTHLWHNDELDGSRWHKQQHSFLSLPVYVRDSTLLALGNNDQRPDYAARRYSIPPLLICKTGMKPSVKCPLLTVR